MPKLLDREPTLEMIDAGREALNLAKRISADEIPLVFSYMYDAAPEIQKNPVAWMIDDDGDVEYNGVDRFSCGRTGGVPLYTFPPDAQAEIVERIKELEQELQTTADALAEVEQIRLGLENVRLFAARHRKEDWALLILGFCSEAGVVGSALR